MRSIFHTSVCTRTLGLIGWLLLSQALTGLVRASAAAQPGFVRAAGSRFALDGKPFFFGGANCYFLMVHGADPSHRASVDEILERASGLGLSVIRTWGFNDGPGEACLQCTPDGQLTPATLDALDYVLYKASELGLRVIIPLVNYWPDYGGMDQYVAWAGGGQREEFYTNLDCRNRYKRFVENLLLHENTYSHKLYKDDPAIFSLELANEPEAPALGDAGLANWVSEMSAHIKSLDQNHMVSVGLEGFYSFQDGSANNPAGWMKTRGADFRTLQQIPTIDFAVAHSLPDDWKVTSWDDIETFHSAHIADAHSILKKPFVLEEFAKRPAAVRDEWLARYVQLMASQRGDGWLVWMLGCPELASWDDGYWIYPADTESQQILQAGASAMRDLIAGQTVPGVCSLKTVPTGATVYTTEPQVVSAVLDYGFYVQEQGRCGGMLVTGSCPVSVGGTVRICGIPRIGGSGPYLEPIYVDPVSEEGPEPNPLAMRIGAIGGEPPAGWPGDSASNGLYNLGLFTEVFGRTVPPVPGDIRLGFTLFDRTDSLGSARGILDMAYLFGSGGSVAGKADLPGDPGVRFRLSFQGGDAWRDVAIGMPAPDGGIGGASAYRLAVRNDADRPILCCLFLEAGGWHQSPWRLVPVGATVTHSIDLTGLPLAAGSIGLKVGLNVGASDVTVDASVVGYYYGLYDGSGQITVLGSQPEDRMHPVAGISMYSADIGKLLLVGDSAPIPLAP